jgi:hypothetical protein
VKSWHVESLGVLKHLTAANAEKALDFVAARKWDLLRVACWSWGIVLAMTFTAIMTVRLALHFPL